MNFITLDILEITWTLQLLTIYTNYKVFTEKCKKTKQSSALLGVGMSK